MRSQISEKVEKVNETQMIGNVHNHNMATEAVMLSAVSKDKDAAREKGDFALVLLPSIMKEVQGIVELNCSKKQ